MTVEGKIPSWLNGDFYRNGPGLFGVGETRFAHWFDGLAMLHKFEMRAGSVQYQSRYIESKTSAAILHDGVFSYPEFATDPCKSIFKKLQSVFIPTQSDNPKVNVVRIEDRLMALGETRFQIEFDAATLKSKGILSYGVKQTQAAMTTAHPYVEGPKMYNMVLKYGPFNSYNIVEYDANTSITRTLCSIPTQSPSYIHSIGMSEKYFILLEYPFSVRSIDFVLFDRPFIQNFNWNNKSTRIWIVDRKTKKVIFKDVLVPFFSFHFINAFDTDHGVTFDIIQYPDAEIINSFYLKNIVDFESSLAKGKLHRYEIDLTSEKWKSRQLSEATIELASKDSRYQYKGNYRYVYGMGLHDDDGKDFYNQLVKVDLSSGDAHYWYEEGCFPGEPVFVPSPESQSDEDGVLLSILLTVSGSESCSDLLLLNAGDMTEIARVRLPESILPGFHGFFDPA